MTPQKELTASGALHWLAASRWASSEGRVQLRDPGRS